jgi:methionyl-tRNA formyltransferase
VTTAVVFAYSEVGVRCLKVLIDRGVHIPLLFTHRDDPDESRWFGSVAALAAEHGIRAVTPDDPNTNEWVSAGRSFAPDFIFSFYYRHMLKLAWLGVPARGALNMHGSLLPKYRGRAPVHWAILNGEMETGASLHYMLEKPDAGALVDQQAVPILPDDDALEVSRRVADAAAQVLERALPKLIQGTAVPRPLDLSKGSYFGRRRPEDGRIDWRKGATSIHDLVRAVAPPFPGAFSDVAGFRVFVHKTILDEGAPEHPQSAPCLYVSGGRWYADTADGRRLLIAKMQVNGRNVTPNDVPAAWPVQPIALD